MKGKKRFLLASMWRHRAKAHSHTQDQDHCTSFPTMPATLTDSAALPSATSPPWERKEENNRRERLFFFKTQSTVTRNCMTGSQRTQVRGWPVRVLGERGQTLQSSERLQLLLLGVLGPTSSPFALSSGSKQNKSNMRDPHRMASELFFIHCVL